MKFTDILRKKRNGSELCEEEIKFFIDGCMSGAIPDYQISAFLMAVYFRGMSVDETVHLTLAMRDSGSCADLSGVEGKKADKHSTGGVGDKTTLIVAPIAAACGVNMLKMSGRGLGHTGGTVDKLESIPGFRTEFSAEEIVKTGSKTHIMICSQSENIAPADKLLYALRDVTETIDSIPLIASSIMSKKLAVGADVIVLDVKYGSGAFMKTKESAKELADMMVKIGNIAGVSTSAVLSDMNKPLGFAVGNALEVMEAIDVLKNRSNADDLTEECILLAGEILFHCGIAPNKEECRLKARRALEDGSALEKFRECIKAQGGNAEVIDDFSLFPKAKYTLDILSGKSGLITAVDCAEIGRCSALTGAGRFEKGDAVDPAAGLIIRKKPGDRVTAGDVLAELHTSKTDNYEEIAARLVEAYVIE